ncbi:MAG TPA: sigma-70 family RNA polymerase sigma factor [Parapedobacter sp.]|uniref:RNA polymerase sigma factor n=1 Tax=Parapedobacter sp. TaxID=1958893 RepID=UPI002CC6412F|nr:sigma-70 family RNA polymerase sigma factor [Parapedobacter sp.]HWK58522.1 sigma-70 family RNA polymerase sigma factor [Parapedobacter sp.]
MKLEQRTDRELIRLYVAGDEAGLEILIDRYKAKLYTSIYLLVKDETLAEDIFQDTFIKVINTLRSGRYNEEGKFLPWVMRIAHNLVIDYYRKERRTPVVVNSEGFDIFDVLQFSDESAEARMIREQTHRDLRRMIQRLPDDQKEVLIMRHYGDMSFKEIAAVTEVSINTALGRMRYALNNLRKMMYGDEAALRAG